MRYIFIVQVILLITFSSCQSKVSNEIIALSLKVDSLTSKIDELNERNRLLEEEFTWIENEMAEVSKLKPVKTTTATTSSLVEPVTKVVQKATEDWQCLAITNSGSRCSRPATKDSKYCWQHKKTYEPDKPEKKEVPAGTVPTDK